MLSRMLHQNLLFGHTSRIWDRTIPRFESHLFKGSLHVKKLVEQPNQVSKVIRIFHGACRFHMSSGFFIIVQVRGNKFITSKMVAQRVHGLLFCRVMTVLAVKSSIGSVIGTLA